MKQFKTILSFELKSYFKNKIFLGITIFLVILIAIVMFFPRIASFFKDSEETKKDEKSVMIITGDLVEDAEYVSNAFSAVFTEYDVKVSNKDIKEIKEQISDGDVECAFDINEITSYKYYVNNLALYDDNLSIADEVLRDIARMNLMVNEGISAEQAQNIISLQINHGVETIGKNQANFFFYTYIMIFALYMVILLYGQMIATNVATEKSSRAMELLITSAKSTAMMFGKVIASCLAGLFQLICVFGTVVLFYKLNKTYWNGNEIINMIFDIPADLLIYMLVFFILGFLIYAFMYGSMGSTVSKLEDINTAVMPITLIFIFGFIVIVVSMSSGSVDNTLMKVCSYIPFTSPMAMFTRIAMSNVPLHEIIISIAVLVASVIGIGFLAAKIYRVGVLMYGNRFKFGAIMRAAMKE